VIRFSISSFGFWIKAGRVFRLALAALLFALCLPAYAQQQTKLAKIGWLGEGGAGTGREYFRQALPTWAMFRAKI
jgi:hypothetical protein